MKTLLRMALMATVCALGTPAWSQYTFSVQVVVTGNCFSSNSTMAERNIRQVVDQFNAKARAIPLTKEECQAMSRQFAGELTAYEFSEYGCTIKIVITPCVCASCQVESSPGPEQGGSFNSANPGSEVSDWADDVDARRQALDMREAPTSAVGGTGDKAFDEALRKSIDNWDLQSNKVNMPDSFELLANMDNVRRYLEHTNNLMQRYLAYPDPGNLVDWFHDEFERVSGFSVNAIMQKLPSEQSDEERQALFDYQVFRRGLADQMLAELEHIVAQAEEAKVYELAVLSEDCYRDTKHQYLSETNYEPVNAAHCAPDDPMRAFAETIEKANKYTGFHAELYYNSVTGEYTVAFEGSEFHYTDDPNGFKADWAGCNIPQGFGFIPEQYVLAKIIADALPEGVNVNFTGHSLGGGLASVAGAVSGAPTYTYNPEGVNTNIQDAFGIREKVGNGDYDIKAYQSEYDLLTSAQEGEIKGVIIGIAYGVGIGPAVQTASKAGVLLAPAIGDKVTVENGGIHKITPMIEHFHNSFNDKNASYDPWRESIHDAGYGYEQQTQNCIQIIWSE